MKNDGFHPGRGRCILDAIARGSSSRHDVRNGRQTVVLVDGETDPRYHGTSPVPVEVRAMHGRALLIRRPSGTRHRAPLVAPIVAALMLWVVGPVQATITPSATALTIAQAIASSSLTVTGASFVAVHRAGRPMASRHLSWAGSRSMARTTGS